jgi:hypothetical protein
MSNEQPKVYVVVKNGVKVTNGMSLDEANKEASRLQKLVESNEPTVSYSVVPLLLG